MRKKQIKHFKCPIQECNCIFSGDLSNSIDEKIQDEVKKHLAHDHSPEELVDALVPLIRKEKDTDRLV